MHASSSQKEKKKRKKKDTGVNSTQIFFCMEICLSKLLIHTINAHHM